MAADEEELEEADAEGEPRAKEEYLGKLVPSKVDSRELESFCSASIVALLLRRGLYVISFIEGVLSRVSVEGGRIVRVEVGEVKVCRLL